MKLPVKINQREKRVIQAGAIVAVCIILYYFAVWYSDMRGSFRDHIEARRMTVEKQARKIHTKPALQKNHARFGMEVKLLEAGLLKGNKPPVVAAKIQSILKQIASSIGIEITLEKTLNPVDEGLYLGIPVEIGFTASTEKLNKMLHQIKTSKLLLSITEMKIIVRNVRNPSNAQTTLTVSGFINKPGPEEE